MRNSDLKVDTHVHVLSLDEKNNGSIFSHRLRRHPFFRIFAMRWGYMEKTDEEFDKYYIDKLVSDIKTGENVDKAVILGMDGVYDSYGKMDLTRTAAYVPNDYIFKLAGEHKDVFLPGPSINPDRADALDELDRCFENGAALIKWLPNTMHFDPSDKKYIPFYKKISGLGLPLLSHTGYEHCIPGGNHKLGHPELLKLALDNGVTIIAGHAGATGIGHGEESFDSFLEMLIEYPHLFADIAAFTGMTRFVYLSKLISDTRFTSKILQATDYPAPPLPWLFPGKMTAGKMIHAARSKNIFTRDTRLKLSLGIPDSIFTNWWKIAPKHMA